MVSAVQTGNRRDKAKKKMFVSDLLSFQPVGRWEIFFILNFICCHFNQLVGKNLFYFIWRRIHFHVGLICTSLNHFLFFGRFLTPPSFFL